MTAAGRLRELLASRATLQLPGVYDGLTARLAAQAGFEALGITGNALSVAHVGAPDVGLATLTEVVAAAAAIAGSVPVPVVCDADTGYGGVLNVARTVRALEQAGLAGLILEDQLTPKRCSMLAEPAPVEAAEAFEAKVRTAVWARRDPNLVVIARTDAMASLGLDEAIQRANRYLAAGADVAEIVGPRSVPDLQRVGREVRGLSMVVMMEEDGEGGSIGDLTRDDLSQMGISLALYVGVVRGVVVQALQESLSRLRRDGGSRGYRAQMASGQEWNRVTGLDEYVALQQRLEAWNPEEPVAPGFV